MRHPQRFTSPLPYQILQCNDLFPPFETIRDYVSTMRQQCQTGLVFWPKKLAFQKCLETALTLLPPGHMLIFRNSQKPPDNFNERFYHGTSPAAVLRILAEGLRPSFGTSEAQIDSASRSSLLPGWDNQMLGHATNMPRLPAARRTPPRAPLATVAACRSFEGAMKYPYRLPQYASANKREDEPNPHPTQLPAQLLATDGTYPMRCVVEVVVDPASVLKMPTTMPDNVMDPDLRRYIRHYLEQPDDDVVHLQHTDKATFIQAVYYYACEPSHMTQQQASAKHHTVRTTTAATQLLSRMVQRRNYGGAVIPSCPPALNPQVGRRQSAR